MDFHIDKKTAYLMLGTLIIGMIVGAWLSNVSMHRHMSRMMRGGDMGMMMQGDMRKGMTNTNRGSVMVVTPDAMQPGTPEPMIQTAGQVTVQSAPVSDMLPRQ